MLPVKDLVEVIIAYLEHNIVGRKLLRMEVTRQPIVLLCKSGFCVEFPFNFEDFFTQISHIVGGHTETVKGIQEINQCLK